MQLIEFQTHHLDLLTRWLHTEHVSRWFPEPREHIAWARRPPQNGFQRLIEKASVPVGYLRGTFVDRATLDSIGLTDIPSNSVDLDIFIGEPSFLGQGIGGRALEAMINDLKKDPQVPLIGLTTSIQNAKAHKAFRRVGFKTLRSYTLESFGECYLMVLDLRKASQ